MIRNSEYFVFNGEKSSDYGLLNVNVSSGMLEEPFMYKKNIIESEIRGKYAPYLQSLKHNPLEFQVSFAFENGFDNEALFKVRRWLYTDYYKELYFSEDLERRYFGMFVDDNQLTHNAVNQGYITLNVRCKDCFIYSPEYLSDTYTITNTETIQFTNKGNVNCKPEIWIQKVGDGNVSIYNQSDGNIEFKFTGLVNDEIVYANNENKIIESDLALTYRYDNFNNNFLEMVYGVNNLLVVGNCLIKFRYRFKML